MSLYSMARISRLNLLELQLAEVHGRRGDERSRLRQVRDDPPITWLPDGAGGDPLALETRYAAHVAGAFIPKGNGKALHLLVKFPESVPVESREEAEAALKLAIDFAQATFGGDAVFAARMDRDEKSLTNADLFIAPRYVKQTKHAKKVAISLSRHLKLMAEKRGPLPKDKDVLRAQGRALQDEFATFLRARDFQALRGQPKTMPGPDWNSPEAYGTAVDRKIAAADREVARQDRAEIEGRLADEALALQQQAAVQRDKMEKATRSAGRIMDAAVGVAEDTIKEAEEAALARRTQVAADADQVLATARQEAERKAQAVLVQARLDAEAITAAAKTIKDEAEAQAVKVASDAAALAQGEEQLLASAQTLATARAEVDEALDRTEKASEEAERLLASAELEADKAATEKKAVDAARLQNEATERQLALVSRAMEDDTLALVLEEGPRGVRMSEAAMAPQEREAYRAPWSALARTVARAAASALSKARQLVTYGVEQARRQLEDATRNIVAERTQLDTDRAALTADKTEVARERLTLQEQRGHAQAFVEAWENIPENARVPAVMDAMSRARGLIAQAATIGQTDGGAVRLKRVPDATSPIGSGRDGEGR